MQYSSKFLLRIYLDFLKCYLLSNDSTLQMTITICFFIISHSNIVINTQTFTYQEFQNIRAVYSYLCRQSQQILYK